MAIKLNFINKSNDGQDKEIVLFQQNVATDMAELTVAWKVIRYCGFQCHHPFLYPTDYELSYSDDNGNYAPLKRAEDGQMFAVVPTPMGRRLVCKGPSTSPRDVQVLNALPRGAVNVHIYRGGQLLATKHAVVPQQKAVFSFEPVLFIGVATQVVQGEPLDSAVISNVNQELYLHGVASADIVMTGGGGGPDSTPYVFALENVVMR